jgi:hypothetical protein
MGRLSDNPRVTRRPRPPVLDDTRTTDASVYWSDPPASIDWQACYNERAQHTAELTSTIAALRTDLSSAQTDVSVYECSQRSVGPWLCWLWCGMTSESVVQQRIRTEIARLNIDLWRNNSGACEDKTGRVIRYGLCNDSKGRPMRT